MFTKSREIGTGTPHPPRRGRPSYRVPAASGRRGVVGPWAVTGLVVLLGVSGLVIDVGRLCIAAQRAQDVADSAALAAACELPYEQPAGDAALSTVSANNSTISAALQATCAEDSGDLVYYGPGESMEGVGVLGPWACGMKVTTHVPVEYSLARIVGVQGTVATRSASVLRAPVGGLPIATMWLSQETPFNYGDVQQLLMADGPHYAGVPGSFGFLQAPAGCTATAFELLRGYNLTEEQIQSSFVSVGDTIYASTGVDVGSISNALDAHQGMARLERGLDPSGKWANDVFDNYHNDNPRIMLIPLVSYLGGEGSNAAFRIEKFGAFWLEEVKPSQKWIKGMFIRYDMPGGEPDPSLIKHQGIFATQLVR